MFCRHCGSELKDKAVVCSACGHPVGDDVENTVSAGPGQRWSWSTMFVTIGVFMLLQLIAIIAGL